MEDHVIKNRKTRKTLYIIAAAGFGIGSVYGLITADQAAQYASAAAVLLGIAPTALAAANVPAGSVDG